MSAEGVVAVRDASGATTETYLSDFQRDLRATTWRLHEGGLSDTERALMKMCWNAAWVIDQVLGVAASSSVAPHPTTED